MARISRAALMMAGTVMLACATVPPSHPELRLPDGSFTASGNGGQRLTVIPPIDTLVVNLMNTDEAGRRIGSNEWDVLLAEVLAARAR